MVKYESGRVAQKWSSASRICEYIVLNINIFNIEYHAIIEIVECESGRVAQKWSSASQICEYRSTQSITNNNSKYFPDISEDAINLAPVRIGQTKER